MSWFPLALAAAVLYGLHNLFTRAASGKISDALGALVLESTAAIGIAIYVLVTRREEITRSAAGVGWSLAAGLCVGVGTVLYFAIFRRGGALSAAAPIVLAGGSALMALGGVAFFGESLTPLRALGLVLAVAGVALLRFG